MTFEQQVEGALHAADLFQPSPDLFAKVQRSIGEDLAHRSRVRRVIGAVAASLVAVLVYVFVAVDVTSGVWSMSFTALEVLVTIVMVGIVIVLGPAIRRFGETFERDIFRGSPETGTHMLKLLDVAYYLIFGAYIMMTLQYQPTGEHADTVLLEWVHFEVFIRLPGLLLLIGVLHVALVMSLPVVGLVFSANRRRERITAGGESNDPGMDKVDSAITGLSWFLAIDLLLLMLPLILGLILGGAGE